MLKTHHAGLQYDSEAGGLMIGLCGEPAGLLDNTQHYDSVVSVSILAAVIVS